MTDLARIRLLQVAASATLILWCIYSAGYGPSADTGSVLLSGFRNGWFETLSNALQSLLGARISHLLLLIICALPFIYLIFRSFASQLDGHGEYGLASGLLLANPLILWSAHSTTTIALPLLAVLLWLCCSQLHKVGYAESSIAAGLFLVVFVTATPVTLYFSVPLMSAIALLLPIRLVRRSGIASVIILLAPLVLSVLAIFYWQMVMPGELTPDAIPRPPTSVEPSDWLLRHDGAFATAAVEAMIWAVVVCPMFVAQIALNHVAFLKRFAAFCVAVPALAAGLATEMSEALTPLPFLAVMVTAQIALPLKERPQMTLACLYISWLGSALAIWYYAV